MKSSGRILFTFLLLVATSVPAPASVTVSIPSDRDAIVATPHKQNNDGSWGYGWIRKTTRSLIGFNIAPLQGRIVEKAEIKLYVAQHQFTTKGTTIVAHPWDPSQNGSVSDWKEGRNLFNSFEYCDNADYAVKAREYPTFADDPVASARHGATWRCSFDPNYLIPGGGPTNNCGLASLERWSPETPPEGQMGIHEGFMANIDARTAMNPPQNTTTEHARLSSCASPPCNRNCRESIKCLITGGTVDECWRSITINVTKDVQDALLIPGYSNPSWLIKRKVEKDKGGVHWFSREGANCNGRRGPTVPPEATKGIFKLFWDQGRDSSELQPVLVVRLAGSTAPTIPTAVEHCDAYYE